MVIPDRIERLIERLDRRANALRRLGAKDLPSGAFNGGGITCAVAAPEYDWWWEQEYPDPEERQEVREDVFGCDGLKCPGWCNDPENG